jgi:thioredoxin-like negative regulator of GroEL
MDEARPERIAFEQVELLAWRAAGMTALTSIGPAELDTMIAAPGDDLRVLYLWGPDCPNCIIFKRRLPTVLESLADVTFSLYALDVYAHPEVATRFAVHGIPHFLLFKSGKKLGRMSEFRGDRFWSDVIRGHA